MVTAEKKLPLTVIELKGPLGAKVLDFDNREKMFQETLDKEKSNKGAKSKVKDHVHDSCELTGYQFPANFIRLKRTLTVDSISFGECHMIVRCIKRNSITFQKQVYVMGNNQWGQLGIDPFRDDKSSFISKLEELELQRLKDKNYEVKEVACGSNHTLLLLETIDD